MKIDISGQLAVVTGGSGQLGRVIVRTLAECGANIAIHYLNSQQKAAELAEQVKAMGVKAVAVQADISDEASVVAMHSTIVEQMGDPDIIVNNAVTQYKWTSVLEQPLADYESQFRTCVLQNVLMAKLFVPAMIRKNHGRVIAINTECAMQNSVNQSAYVSGKRGMDGMLRVLAKEVGRHNITVNQVAPGWTISDNDRENNTQVQEQYEAQIPMRRRVEDIDIANTVAFLASDLARFISGVYLPVCGGNVMPTI